MSLSKIPVTSLENVVAKSGDTMTGRLEIHNSTETGYASNISESFSKSTISLRGHATDSPRVAIGSLDGGVNGAVAGSAYIQRTNGTSFWDLHLQPFGGRVLMPNQPAFRAYTSTDYNSSGEFYGSPGVWVEQYDRNNNFNSGRFTAPVQGTYLFSVMWDVNAALTGIAFHVNGVAYASWEPTGVSNGWESYQYSTHIYLNAGDYVSLYGTVFTSGSNHFHMGSGRWGHFSGHLIG